MKGEPVIYNNIDGNNIEKAIRSMNGSAGPSGMDSDMWKRLLCSKLGVKTNEKHCDSIANFIRGGYHPNKLIQSVLIP